jgi:hypothetical protein
MPWSQFGILLLLKINVDFALLYNTAVFFDRQDALKSYVAASLLYPFFALLIAVLAMTGTYRWKGRDFRK